MDGPSQYLTYMSSMWFNIGDNFVMNRYFLEWTEWLNLYAESRFKLKHSLDSDEEDERDAIQDSRLGDEDLAAQEDTTVVRFLVY